MFKLESYITPVILSYVEKYVKNFKPEQSQVSLWGGDASFQNLDLRLEVLEEQLNLPFTFVSGHIHELLIHVPWVKITSEPIVVTINTIECILNLKNQRPRERNTRTHYRPGLKSAQDEAPPGYIKSIVAKVINNITINCNNLILKYVEEDIVLSVNVRFLSMRSANEHWEAAFADVSNNEVGLRKIVAVEDLTLCLDKMDTSGKIEIYQDPVLYRCSMSIRLMINYNNNIIKYASLTRFDLHCDKMEFSITEQQLPMLLRLVALIMNRRANQSGIRSNKLSHSADERAEVIEDDADQVHNASTARPGWSSWVWNAMTSFLPVDWDPDGSQMQEVPSTGHIIHMGVYIDEAVLTFKTIETVQEQLFYKSRKIRYNPFLGLQVTGYVMSMLVKGVHMSHIQLGLGSIHLHPRGSCSCGYPEVANDLEPPLYIQAGTIHNDYLKHSFFDENLVDHTKWKIYYSEYDVNYHLSTVNVSSMLERSPAFGMDIICSIDIPDDFPLEKLSELESNFEYSDFPERKVVRYAMGDLKIKLCSGLMHRINGVKSAAIYDYSIHMANKCETNSDDLPPVTMEEYEALRENIPMIETYFTFHQVQIQFQLTDHSTMRSPYQKNPMENIVSILDPALLDDTYLSVECSGITGSIVQPMYSFRLVSCASQQADIAPDMLNKCYAVSNIEVCGMQSTLYLAKQCHTIIVMPCTLKALKKSLVHPQYWQHMGVIHDQMECEIVDITLTGTKSKLMAAASIVMSVIDPEQSYGLLFCSSLLNDARYEKDSVYLEISLDHICWKQIKSLTTISIKIDVDAVKAFALHDTQQAFILSGPEVDIDQQIDNSVLLTAMLQYSEIRSDQVHPAILSFRISEVRCSFDPLLCRWLQYEVIYNKSTDVHISKPGAETSTAEDIFSDTDVRKKMFRTLHESVHSLSDKDKKRSTSQTEWSKRISVTEDFKTKMATADDMEFEDQSESNNFLKFAQLYPFCRQLILCGSIAHFVIFIPTITMDGIGVDGIQQAKDRALNSDPNLHILVVVTPSLFIHSANVQFEQLCPHLGRLPCKLPVEMWSQEYHSFPWTLRLTNLNCYTLKSNLRMSLIQNVDFTITIDITTKNTMKDLLDSSIGGLGLCIYVDTSPIVLSISDEQITLLNIIESKIRKVITIPRYSHKKPFLTEQEDMNFYVPKTPSSYTQVMFPENTTTPSSVSTAPDGSEQEPEVPVITAMIQWTITKMSLKVYIMEEATSTCMKFALELEDIITTLDWQPIYLKLKNKIATATISHYIRTLQHQHWKLGDYTGLIMLGRESNLEQIDETGFLSVTFTRAQSGNVHTRWGAQKYPRSHKERAKGTSPLSVGGYITEIDITIQRVDIILPLDVVSKFMLLMKPFVRPDRTDGTSNDDYAMLPMLRRDDFLNKSLPLIYLEFKGMNLMMPISCHIDRLQHDLLMIQLDGISVTPSPENPICRTILRSDIYEFAAQSNILNIPGSSVEDRQYQVNIKGICACTTTWQNYQQNNTKRISKPCLYTMKENPALEWNNLACGSNLEPQPLTCLLISRFDLRLIIAPAVILYSSKIVCGGAVEITCLTEINVSINLDQIKLIWAIYSGISNILSHYSDAAESVYQTDVDSPFSTPVLLSPQVTHNTMVSKEDESDHVADSGINFESSSISYTAARNIPRNENSTVVPLEILVNCGTVTIFLNVMTRTTMEATSGLSKAAGNNDKYSEPPFLQVMLIEPNFYISQLNGTEKMQISCFDLTVSFGVIKQSDSSPIAKSVECKLIESKNGTPHPETGIPPSFIILKWEKSDSTSMRLSVDMDRPTKVNYSLSVFKYIDRIIKQISTCFIYHGDRRDSANSGLYQTKTPPTCAALPNLNKKRQSTKFDLPELSFVTKQLVLSLNTTSETNILISVTKLSGNARTCKTDKVLGNVTLNSLIISEQRDTEINVLLYPTCCDIRVNVFWETWQDSYTDPQVIIQAVCGNAHCAFGPHQMKIVENMIQEYRTFMDYTNMYCPMEVDGNDRSTSKTEQHYKDDLKAGAFQFVVGDVDELPSPYQVTFSVYPEKAMVWKYPQPRIITGLTVTPIPFEITDNIDLVIDTISCSLEYWSDSHREYRRYIEFNLTETENYRPELPTMVPTKAVASIWRVALSVKGNPQPTSIMISPQVLAGCLRVDSYFNADIIPNLQLTVSTGTIHVSMVAPLKSSGYNKLPHPLGTFRLSSIIPEMQCVAQLEHTSTSIVFNKWPSGQVLMDVGGKLNVKLLDYGLLRMQSVIEQLESSIQVLVSNETRILIECNPFSVKFGPSIAHTLAVSTNLWLTSTGDQNTCPVILTQIVIANDSNITICFGQSGSTDNVVLHSRECHFYHWRHANNKMLHIAIENSGWSWSQPFCVKKNGKQQVIFRNLSMHLFIYATVISLSATQKLITFSGSLILANRLIECFEMKLVKYQSESNNRHNVADQHHLINGNDHLPSIVLDSSVNTAMRLRFASPSGLSWTGDIPLRTNSKWGQPWLVKVPLQDRGVFQSIWVRIVQEAIHGEMRFLAVLSPLYMIKSYLPVPVVVKIETPSLTMASLATIKGQGELQQLHCPGTFEHSHQLTFQLESGVSASNPYVPLSYNSVDKQTFFRRPQNEDIDTILMELMKPQKKSVWPYETDNWDIQIPAEQPQTHVQIAYQDAGLVSSTLLVELRPWCFILNTLGCQISLTAGNIELCEIPHNGIIAPPKLEGTFYLKVEIGDVQYTSCALQLARPDWNQGFYMPRIKGLIPVEGNIQASLESGSNVCIITINSKVHDNMRSVRVAASHVICNFTTYELYVATLAVGKTSSRVDFPEDHLIPSFIVAPSKDRSRGTPIGQWYMVDPRNTAEHEALYISLRRSCSWSCPIRVDQNMTQRCVAISDDIAAIPLVITTHEDDGTIYILIYIHNHPQFYIENLCPFRLILGESNQGSDRNCEEAVHFSWRCEIESNAVCYYTAPSIGNRLPDCQTMEPWPKLLLSAGPLNYNKTRDTGDSHAIWSQPIDISQLINGRLEQYVRLPMFGDVKLLAEKHCHTIHLHVVCLSQAEVSAHEIRTRLIDKYSKYQESKSIQSPRFDGEEQIKTTTVLDSSIAASRSSVREHIDHENVWQPDNRLKAIDTSATVKTLEGSLTIYIRGISVVLMQDFNECGQRIEVASICLSDVIILTVSNPRSLSLCACIGDLQLDNQMFDSGGFDFPVVLMSQRPRIVSRPPFCMKFGLKKNISDIQEESLVAVYCNWDVHVPMYACTKVNIKIGPISAFIEDTFISQLLDYTFSTSPPCLTPSSEDVKSMKIERLITDVPIPENIMLEAANLRTPLRVQMFTIEPISLLLSVHTSVRLYVALDHSPLYFGAFEREHLLATFSGLVNALAMHYLSGALFGAGWVVGSLEILGSPGGFAQALGCGLKDFVTLPIQGILRGPWSFIIGITQGSTSLIKHLTAGTVNSVTKLASSVARNLDRLTLDEEHLQRQEESRRMRPQGMAQGLYQGVTGFGISLLAAIAGLAHHPLQQILSGAATPRGLMTGVGLGIVGAVTKPLSGAAELVALTGQGLLEGTGWNPLPTPRQRPIIELLGGLENAYFKYAWELLPFLRNEDDCILYITNVDYTNSDGVVQIMMLIITRHTLVLVNIEKSSVEKKFVLKDLGSTEHTSDPSLLCLYCLRTQNPSERSSSPIDHAVMDQAIRARVERFVRGSSSGCAIFSGNTDLQSEAIEGSQSHVDDLITLNFPSNKRDYFLSLFKIAKGQDQGNDFIVL